MVVNRTATAAGKRYERELLVYLRESGFDTERLRLVGAEDEGDLLLRTSRRRYVIEAKREKGFSLGPWWKEAQVEAVNYALHRDLGAAIPTPVVVHHARNKGLGESYVTMSLDWFLSILEEGA